MAAFHARSATQARDAVTEGRDERRRCSGARRGEAKMKQRPGPWLLLVALMFLLTGCGERPGGLRFAVGGAPHEAAFWQVLVEEFRAETGIDVRLDRQPTDTDLRRQELVFALQARQSDPDLFLLDGAWLAQFAAADWLMPLDPEEMEADAFFERVIAMADTYEGALVALPVYVDGGVLYYREDLLAAHQIDGPPETWSELIEIGARVQAGQRARDPHFYAYVWQGAQYEGLVCNFLEIAASAGGGIRFEEGDVEIDTPANRRALSLMVDLIHRHEISPPNVYTEMKEEESRLFFQNGRALFERNWPYAWARHRAADSPVRDQVRIAKLPHFAGGRSASTLGGWHIGVSRFSDHPEEARRFVRYAVSRAVQKRLAIELGWNPGRTDIYGDPDVRAANPHFAVLADIFAQAVARPTVPYYPIASKALQRHLSAALSGRLTVAEALRGSQEAVEEIAATYAEP
ncbi:MAG: extracellular solute-binding protein [Candidatus Eisenbacteria bacterium]|nr:extracellular solute-binding protein [Candidatus Eisenbacteria bacterium]